MDKRMAVVEPSLGKETLQKDWQQEIDCQVETNDEQEMDDDLETEGQQETKRGQQEDTLVSLFERWDKDDGDIEDSTIDSNNDFWEQILKDAPSCERYRCYNCIGGKCVMLSDADFGHLVKKYRKQYAALDVVEIGDIELEKMFYSLRLIEDDLQKRQRKEREKLCQTSSDTMTVMNKHGYHENNGNQDCFFSADEPIGNGHVGDGNRVDDTAQDWPVEDDPWEDCQTEAWTEEELVGGDD